MTTFYDQLICRTSYRFILKTWQWVVISWTKNLFIRSDLQRQHYFQMDPGKLSEENHSTGKMIWNEPSNFLGIGYAKSKHISSRFSLSIRMHTKRENCDLLWRIRQHICFAVLVDYLSTLLLAHNTCKKHANVTLCCGILALSKPNKMAPIQCNQIIFIIVINEYNIHHFSVWWA